MPESTPNKNIDLLSEAAAYDLEDDDICTRPVQSEEYNRDRFHELLTLIPEDLNRQKTTKEISFQKFLFICDQYQEMPHLVDPYLAGIIDKLVSVVKENMNTPENIELVHEAFKFMYCLTKMRGYKKIVQYLPHENVDFEPLLALLASQDIKDVFNWQTRYMLLIWLSIVCMVPFDLHKFDLKNTSKEETILNRFMDVCMPYLFSTDKCQDASAYVLAKFVSRPDLKTLALPSFFDQLFNFLDQNIKSENHIKLLGILKCLASIFKYGKREELLRYTQPTLKHLIKLDLLTTSSLSLIRKFHIKIIQRIGITCFKAKVANWRYQRGSRVLMEKINSEKKNEVAATVKPDELEEDEEAIPEEIEDIIDQLLNGLKDQETIVRWSAAKGIGRITNRFSKEMAHDVLSSVLDLFTFVEDVFAWHGGCLSIAELGRRGLLLPDQLKIVVPIVLNALVFDKKIGNFSFGRNVRDSANYVCWSLARAFEPEVLKPYVNQIASTLLIVTVFDREVNCRRGASAAFQENVGRQGQFPHGIDILTKCDYFAVGQLENCYLHLSKFIADFFEYRQPIVDHLLEHKFNHWDQSIRELTSKALFNLTETCPDYIAFSVLPKLLKHSSSIDLNDRHGAILSLGEIIHGLCDQASKTNILPSRYFTAQVIADFMAVISKLFDSKYFRGSSGEYMRPAVCFFIKKLSLSGLFRSGLVSIDEKFIGECENFIRECIEYNKEAVQQAACQILPYYCDFKFLDKSIPNKVDSEKLIQSYLHCMKATSKEYVRSGYCLALGNLPSYLFKDGQNFVLICRALIQGSQTRSGPIGEVNIIEPQMMVTKPGDQQSGWVQARRDSIKALEGLFGHVKNVSDFEAFGLTSQVLLEVFECFLYGLQDYSIDSKGDSGSKVREASIQGLEFFVLLCAQHTAGHSIVDDRQLMVKVLGGIMQQAVERIDRTRSIAGRTLASLLHSKSLSLKCLENGAKLRAVFTEKKCARIDWNLAHLTFPLFVSLLVLPEFRLSIVTGLIYSIGSLTESLVKPAIKSFLGELKTLKAEKNEIYREIVTLLLGLCQNHLKNDRLATSLIKTIDLAVQNDLFDDEGLREAHIPTEFLDAFLANVRLTKDYQKLNVYVDLFCDMLQFEEDRVRERSMIQLMIMLCHQYPRVRKITSGKLFESLINYSDELFENDEAYEECVGLLTDTNWDQSLDIIRPIRNRICDLTKTPKPVLVTK